MSSFRAIMRHSGRRRRWFHLPCFTSFPSSAIKSDCPERVFQYSPLPIDKNRFYIRLFELQKGKAGDPVHFNLVTQELYTGDDDACAPPYEALSYCWGDEQETRSIYDNQHLNLPVRSNLHDALLELRLPDQNRLLWIDAICINQSDDVEKATQIPNMRNIYRLAKGVIVWLGKEDADSETAFKIIRHIVDKHPWDQTVQTVQEFSMYAATIRNNFDYSDADWQCLARMFDKPWFRRLWVIQEVAVAQPGPDAVTVRCGRYSIPWDVVGHAATWLNNGQYAFGLNVITTWPAYYIHTCRRIHLSTDIAGYDTTSIMEHTRGFDVSIDHDRVYAVLGLLISNSFAAELGVNYTQPLSKLYSDFAKKLIRSQKSLDILSCRIDLKYTGKCKVPSWVPDWTSSPWSIPLGGGSNYEGYNACDGMSYVEPSCDEDESTLSVNAILIDQIDTVSDPYNIGTPGPEGVSAEDKMIFDICLIMSSREDPYITGESQADALWRSLLANRATNRFPLQANDHDHFMAFMVSVGNKLVPRASQEMPALHTYEPTATGTDTRAIEDISTPAEASMRIGDVSKFEHNLLTSMKGRTFFTTKLGFFGNGPVSTRVGDTVGILAGGKTPFVLRDTALVGLQAQMKRRPEAWRSKIFKTHSCLCYKTTKRDLSTRIRPIQNPKEG
jgi:hypothetical protein